MLDKMIGVSPPLKGEALDSKLAHGKDFRETSKSDYKKDFEKALEKKLNQKKEDSVSKKEGTRETEEFGAGKKEKKSLGGIKKKVTENDDKMVSNVMASNENKVEIPDSKIDNLAEIEVDIPEKNKVSAEAEASANALGGTQLQQMQPGLVSGQIEMPKSVSAEAPTGLKQLDAQLMQPITEESSLKSTEGLAVANLTSQVNTVQEQLTPQLQPQGELQQQLQAQAQPQGKVQDRALNLEDELSADVGFTADQGMQQSSQNLLQKMKAFEVDKNLVSGKPQSFEQNVLSRLQNEQMQNVKQFSDKNLSEKNQSDSGQENSGGLKDLKSDLLDAKQLHLAGPAHAEFKTQLGATVAAQSQSLAGKLEENREANISEIMKQAQYLVTKGGGEVSVKMSPEGLGDLHLKVMFQDGKLNIEMQTQNKDIKKLVEDSLSELKSGLAAHRLSLEHVKVDTVNATNADNNTQFQSNLKHGNGGSQEQARELWRDFQGNMNNQSGKRSSYTGSSIQPNVSPRSTATGAAATANAVRTYGGTKGATVNRVA